MSAVRRQDEVLRRVEEATDELVDFTRRLIRIPTVNPPGNCYREAAELIGEELGRHGFDVAYSEPDHLPEHTVDHPRRNVVGSLRGVHQRPGVHLNGHFDVVPPGSGWTRDPFGGEISDNRVWGRGAADMKGGLAAAIYAVAAVRRAELDLEGSIEISGTVDEESGGFAGVAALAESGVISADRIDHVIIPEPFGPGRICIGHRGVYWFKVEAEGEIGHGSMPFLGVNAIDAMSPLLEAFRNELVPKLSQRRTAMPIVPAEARLATLNINAIHGGQAGEDIQTPCVADHCEVIFDRRYLPEEGFDSTKREIEELVRRVESESPERKYRISDLMVVHPVEAPRDSRLVAALEQGIRSVTGNTATLVASPGTYDQKHVTRIGGIDDCVAYGPGRLELAHQPDEYCEIDDLVASAQVMALALVDLLK